MTLQDALAKLQGLLDTGETARAATYTTEILSKLAEEPFAIRPVLDRLDRQKQDEALLQLVTELARERRLRLDALVYTLRVHFRAGDHQASLQTVNAILALASNNAEALRTGGRIGNLQKNDDLALGYWERLATAYLADAEAPLQAARIRARRQDYRPALDWGRRAADLQPENPEPLQIAAAAGIELGWPEECDALLSRLFGLDRGRAQRIAAQLVAEIDTASAARLLSLLLQRYPNDKGLAGLAAKVYPEWMFAGLERELASHDFEAAAFYCAARRLRPDLQDAQNSLDRLIQPSLLAMREAFNGRDFEAAIEHGNVVTRGDPDCFEAWQTIARAHFNRGDAARALDAVHHCTELRPEDGRSWLTQGIILNHIGTRSAAFAAFEKARKFSGPLDPELRREAEAAIATLEPQLIRDAQQTMSAGNLELAWSCCEAASAIRPDDSTVEHLKRQILRRLRERINQLWEQKSPDVVPLCLNYLKKSPDDRYAALVLGRTLMGTRAYAEALPVWEALCKSHPDNSHFHLQVARCCRSLKIRERGLVATQAALRLDPELHEAAEVAEYLRNLAPAAAAEAQRSI